MTKEEFQINKVNQRVPKWFKNPQQINSKILIKFLELQKTNNNVDLEMLEYECDLEKFKTNFAKMIDFTDKNSGKVFDKIDDNIYLWEPVEKFILNEYNKYLK